MHNAFMHGPEVPQNCPHSALVHSVSKLHMVPIPGPVRSRAERVAKCSLSLAMATTRIRLQGPRPPNTCSRVAERAAADSPECAEKTIVQHMHGGPKPEASVSFLMLQLKFLLHNLKACLSSPQCKNDWEGNSQRPGFTAPYPASPVLRRPD